MQGELLMDRYRVERLLGEGGMGLVYAGVDIDTGDAIAIKTLHSEFASRQDLSGRFMREAKAHGLLDHPNIAEMHTVGSRADGTLFVVMELVEGQELADWIGRDDLFRSTWSTSACRSSRPFTTRRSSTSYIAT